MVPHRYFFYILSLFFILILLFYLFIQGWRDEHHHEAEIIIKEFRSKCSLSLSLYVHSVLSFSVEKQSIITLDAILLTTLFVCVCRVKQQQRFRRRGQEQQILQISLVNGNWHHRPTYLLLAAHLFHFLLVAKKSHSWRPTLKPECLSSLSYPETLYDKN